MNIYEKQRVHEICESVKEELLYNVLEEGEISERNLLLTKRFLNETVGRIEKALIQEGLFDYGRNVIEEAIKIGLAPNSETGKLEGGWTPGRVAGAVGAGAGAVGFLEKRRFYPTAAIETYIKNPLQITEELLTEDELLTEKIFLGLRSNIGLEKSTLTNNIQQKAEILCDENKLKYDHIRYYNDNFFLSDELTLFLLG